MSEWPPLTLAKPGFADVGRTERLLRDARLKFEVEADAPFDMVESLDPEPDPDM